VEVALHLLGRKRVMYAPDNHRHETDFAVPYPAGFIFEVALGDNGRFAELTTLAHFTVKVTDDL
jgi:hypothetical protein